MENKKLGMEPEKFRLASFLLLLREIHTGVKKISKSWLKSEEKIKLRWLMEVYQETCEHCVIGCREIFRIRSLNEETWVLIFYLLDTINNDFTTLKISTTRLLFTNIIRKKNKRLLTVFNNNFESIANLLTSFTYDTAKTTIDVILELMCRILDDMLLDIKIFLRKTDPRNSSICSLM